MAAHGVDAQPTDFQTSLAFLALSLLAQCAWARTLDGSCLPVFDDGPAVINSSARPTISSNRTNDSTAMVIESASSPSTFESAPPRINLMSMCLTAQGSLEGASECMGTEPARGGDPKASILSLIF